MSITHTQIKKNLKPHSCSEMSAQPSTAGNDDDDDEEEEEEEEAPSAAASSSSIAAAEGKFIFFIKKNLECREYTHIIRQER